MTLLQSDDYRKATFVCDFAMLSVALIERHGNVAAATADLSDLPLRVALPHMVSTIGETPEADDDDDDDSGAAAAAAPQEITIEHTDWVKHGEASLKVWDGVDLTDTVEGEAQSIETKLRALVDSYALTGDAGIPFIQASEDTEALLLKASPNFKAFQAILDLSNQDTSGKAVAFRCAANSIDRSVHLSHERLFLWRRCISHLP